MEKELHILMLEDVPFDAELEEHELRKSGLVFTLKVVDTKEAFLKELDEFSPDIILSDYDLPFFDGLTALRIAKEKCPDVPFILVSGKLGEEFAIEKLKEGATDYVLKGNLKRLVPSVKRALEEAKMLAERKQVEEALRMSEALLSNAMKMVNLGYWEYDVAKDIFTFNDNFYAIFRTSAEQVGGYKMSSADYVKRFIHPEAKDIVGVETRKAIETDDPNFSRQLEHRIIYADGDVGYITVRFFIVKDEKGRTIKTYGVNQDVTERKRAGEALRKELEFNQNILNTAQAIVLLLDINGYIVKFNLYMEEISGYRLDEVRGKDWFSTFLPKENLDRTRTLFKKAISDIKTQGNIDSIVCFR